jgi:DNA-binding LacI/PurR family transcriptional regulator
MTGQPAVTREREMPQPHSVSSREQVVDTMIDLTRLSHLHRAIIAGSDSLELYLALRRRGFIRVATTATCRIPRGQHAIGLITGQNSLQAIEAALTRISPFLCTSATIAVLIDSRESGLSLKIRSRLEQMGFRIEAGVRCQQGLVLSAYRQSFGQMENAA